MTAAVASGALSHPAAGREAGGDAGGGRVTAAVAPGALSHLGGGRSAGGDAVSPLATAAVAPSALPHPAAGRRRATGACLAAALLACLAACRPDSPEYALHEFSGPTMGTAYAVRIKARRLPLPRSQLQAQLDAVLGEVNQETSTYLPQSGLMRLNAAGAGQWVPVSAALMEVLQAAQEAGRLTRGAFDATVGPVVNLWGFGPAGHDAAAAQGQPSAASRRAIPTQAQQDAAQRRVGYEKLLLDPGVPAVKKTQDGMFIDLSGIAKGYGVDRLADYLEELGIGDYLVDIGGELRGRGTNLKNAPWRIGIEKPVPGRREAQIVIGLDNSAMATSGDYRNFFEQDGRRYSHVMAPRTGRPAPRQPASVTVLHATATMADALATGLLAAGPQQGFALALEHRIAACFILRGEDGLEEKYTPAFAPHRAR